MRALVPVQRQRSLIAVYPECPGLRARQSYGAYSTPAGVGGGWRFDAPPGTGIVDVALQGSLKGYNGWQASAYTEGPSARELVGCPGLTCPGGGTSFQTYPTYNATSVVLRVRCGASSCSNNADSSMLYVSSASFTLSDGSFPSASLAGGSLISGGWRSGAASLVVDGSDNIGIQEVRALVDGVAVRSVRRDCAWGLPVPCPNGAVSLDVPTSNFSDGAHSVAAQVVDASGNVGTSGAVTIYVDNTAPAQPLDAKLDRGAGWRSTNSFDLTWRNPPQTQAPIAGAAYRLCPSVAANASSSDRSAAQARCVQGSKSGNNIDEIENLKVPDAGAWNAHVWLVDAAGNQQPATAAEVDGLGFDDTPPASPTFVMAADPQDPARVHVSAGDKVSGLASGVVEVRRDGQNSWQPLATDVGTNGLTAFMDDEVLPKGLYFLRARVSDAAGLESSNDRDGAGQPATLKLPIRLASHLAAGRYGRKVCRGHGKRRSCRRRLAVKPNVRIGRTTHLHGQLRVGGKAMPSTPIEVWRRLDLDGAQWARIATVTTSKTGHFSYKAPRGPARAIRFRYPGTGTIRGRNGDVALRVRAGTTLRPSRRNAINGEYVTFRGHLKGGWIPASGVLVELQVFSRGQWRTFAQPRAVAGSGRWAYRYRFETVRGRATFRFRARIRRQPDYPFTTGSSSSVRVKVHGL